MRLEINNITKKFSNGRGESSVVLDGISFEVTEEEFVCFLGPSGCGKTTLLRIIAGLELPTKGEIILDGSRIKEPTSQMGMIFQEYSLLPWCSVAENVSIGLEIQKVHKEECITKVRKYLDLVNLSGFAESYPYELSGGMRQRVAIARALAVEPTVLLMDEPFGALDPQTRKLIQTEILEIQEKTKKMILFVTHSVDEAVFLADKLVILSASPAKIHEIVPVSLERPRDRTSPDFGELRQYVLDLLERLGRSGT